MAAAELGVVPAPAQDAEVVEPPRLLPVVVDAVVADAPRYIKTVWHGENGSVWYVMDTQTEECIWSGRDPIMAAMQLSILNRRG